LLDQVLGLSAGAVDLLIEMLGIAVPQRGDEVANINASSQHVVFVTGARFDPSHHPSLLVPRLGRVARLPKATQNLGLVQGPAQPAIIGSGFDQAIERDIAGQPKTVIDAVVFAPRHRLLATIMAIAARSDASVRPVPADAADQAAEQLANLHPRWRLAGPQDHDNRSPGRRIVDMDRQEA